MKPFQIFITSISLFSLGLVHAEPALVEEAFPSSISLFSSDFDTEDSAVIDEELSLLDQEIDEFEDEILALEEELKKDAESFNDITAEVEPVKEEEQTLALENEQSKEEEALAVAEHDEPSINDENSVDAEKAIVADSDSSPAIEELNSQDPIAQAEPELSQDSIETGKDTIASDTEPSPALESPVLSVEFAAEPTLESGMATIQEETSQIQFTAESIETPTALATPEPEQQVVEKQTAPVAIEQAAPVITETKAVAQVETVAKETPTPASIEVNLQQAFSGSPYIYSILGLMSVFAVAIWLYSLLTLRKYGTVSQTFLKKLQNKLSSNQFDDALSLCHYHENVFSNMISTGINTRRHGLPVMIEAMKAEGKRSSVQFWQRIGLLNDIAIIAPMLGLLGTVLGMFYAFYDVNRSIESITTLFDGLGVSVGTTVAGLVVAILALILHSTVKYRLVKTLATVENEAQSFATLIDHRTSVYKD